MKESLRRMLFIYGLAGLAIFGSYYYFGQLNPETDYPTFSRIKESGNIKNITVYDSGEIDGELKLPMDNRKLFSIKVPPFTNHEFEDFRKELETTNPDAVVSFKSSSGGLYDLLSRWGPLIVLIVFWMFMVNRMQSGGAGKVLSSFGKSRAKPAATIKKITFKDVAGQDEAKEELREIIEFLKEPAKFQKLGGKIPKGVLLMGPPGIGKTLLARAVAGEANVPFFSDSGSEFVEMFVGVGASRVRDLFEQGRKFSPCILFIDELDAVAKHRGTGLGNSHDEREQTLNQLLVEMDGFEANEGVIIIAATNRPDVLDPALLRPGRFDRRVVLNKPDIKGRLETLEVHTRKIPMAESVNLKDIARGTTGFSGADLANLVNEAALNAARENQKVVRQYDFEFAKDKVLMGGARKSMIISEVEKRTTAIHEAGHAWLTLVRTHADPLHKVTITPRGMALGLTQQIPVEDQHNYSEDYLTDQLVILMGGRCAEEVLLGQKTTGAQNDIQRATDLARRMVCEWGMSDLGPLDLSSEEDSFFLGKQLAKGGQNCSEETARTRDQAIKNLVDYAYSEALYDIKKNKDAIRRIADELLENESLDADQIRKIAGL